MKLAHGLKAWAARGVARLIAHDPEATRIVAAAMPKAPVPTAEEVRAEIETLLDLAWERRISGMRGFF